MALARRSRIVARPNLAPKVKKPDASGFEDISQAALTGGPKKPENDSAQHNDTSLRPDNGSVSPVSDMRPPDVSDQAANLNDCENEYWSKLNAAGASHKISGRSTEKVDIFSPTTLVPDRDVQYANNMNIGETSRDGSNEGPAIPCSTQVDAESRVDSRFPESGTIVLTGGAQLRGHDVSLRQFDKDSVGNVFLTADRNSEKYWHLATCDSAPTPQSVAENVVALVADANVNSGTNSTSQETVAATATGDKLVSHFTPKQDTVPVNSDAEPSCTPAASSNVGSDIRVISQDNVEGQSPAVAIRPRPRLKVRPNIAAESSRTKQIRHGGATSQHSSVIWQKKDVAQETALESASSDKYSASASCAELTTCAGSDSAQILRQATGNVSTIQAGGARTAKSVCESIVEVITVSSSSCPAAPPPAKKQKTRRKVTSSAEPVDRTKMTMKELLYWNPTSNPMAKPPAQPLRSTEQNVASKSSEAPVRLSEAASAAAVDDAGDDAAFAADPVPQVMVGEDGQIILNESSLVVHSAPVEHQEPTDVAVEDHRNYVTSNSFRKRLCTKFWSAQDTCKFYKALSYVGTDFSMMGKLFPKRTRAELKNKFKREEKQNKKKVDAALLGELRFDAEAFTDSECSSSESRVSHDKAKGRTKSSSTKPSKSSKRRKRSEYESDSSIDDASLSQNNRLDAEEAGSTMSLAEPVPVGEKAHAVSTGSSRENDTALPALSPAGDGLLAETAPTDKQMTVLPVTDPLSGVEAGQLIFVVPDSNAGDVHDGSNGSVLPGQQVIHVYVVSPPD